MAEFQNERHRLNERIRSIEDRALRRNLAKYRAYVAKPAQMAKRGVGEVVVNWNGKTFFEAVDLLPLLHDWLDQHGVETHPTEHLR